MVDNSAVENVLFPAGRAAALRSENRTPEGFSGLLGGGAPRSAKRFPPRGSSNGLPGCDRIGSTGGGANDCVYVCRPVCVGDGGV